MWGNNKILFWGLWLLMMILYWPTWQAGFVSDTTGWLYDIQNSSFWDHINRSHFKVKSLYQFTQLITWIGYQVWGTNPICWHTLHISIHCINVVLLYTICSSIFPQPIRPKARKSIVVGLLLFCIHPSLSEVIVWEASFHYLLGLMMMLSIVRLAQLYLKNGNQTYILASLVIFFCSSFSIELFYLTPLFSCTILCFNYWQKPEHPERNKLYLIKGILPMISILFLHFLLVKTLFGSWIPHNTSGLFVSVNWDELLSKMIKILGHAFLLVRFWPQDKRELFYGFCNEHYLGICALLITLTAMLLFWIVKSKQQDVFAPVILIGCWTLFCLGLVLPLWFPTMFWVAYDRYNYFWLPFGCLALSIGLQYFLPKYATRLLLFLYAFAHIYALIQVNQKWKISTKLIHQLMQTLPNQCNKKVILLNTPQCINGIWMMPASSNNEVQTIKNTLYKEKGKYAIKEVYSYNILSTQDGAHVEVIDSNTLRVAVNQWGTWWWYNDLGAINYENDWFAATIEEYGFRVRIKGNVEEYLILFQNGQQWKTVNWEIKDSKQY